MAATLTKDEAEVKADTRDLRVYVVTAAAVCIRTGKGKNDVRRFKRKAKLRLDAGKSETQMLVRSKLIAEISANGKPVAGKLVRSTALIVTRAMGADDDPAQPPLQEVQPLKASANGIADLTGE